MREQQKAAAKRAAEEQRRSEREQRRIELLARANEAIARGTADVLVEELMRLDDRVAALERKLVNVIVAD